MGMLASLAGLLVSGSVQHKIERTKRTAIYLTVAAIFFVTAYIFALIALASWLTVLYGPVAGAAIVAAGAVVLGVIVLIVMMIADRQEKQRERERGLKMESTALAALGFFKEQPLLTAAVIGGLLFTHLLGSRSED